MIDDDDFGLFDLADIDNPTTRRCIRCRVERPLSMFYIAREQAYEAQGKRMRFACRYCKREENSIALAPRRAMVDRIKIESGCVDCGIRDPQHPEIYDFDHLPGVEKVANVAILIVKGTEEELLAEIAKCEVVCSNCHRIRTRQREHRGFGMEYHPRGKPIPGTSNLRE